MIFFLYQSYIIDNLIWINFVALYFIAGTSFWNVCCYGTIYETLASN